MKITVCEKVAPGEEPPVLFTTVFWDSVPRQGDHIDHKDAIYQVIAVVWHLDKGVLLFVTKEE